MKIWLSIIAFMLITVLLLTQVNAIAGTAIVGGVAIAADIIVSLGASVIVGASLKEAVQQIAAEKQMTAKEWIQETMQDFSAFMGTTWENFMNIFTSGVGYTPSGVITFNKATSDLAADFVEYAVVQGGLSDYIEGYAPTGTLPEQSLTGTITIESVIEPIAWWQTIESMIHAEYRDPQYRNDIINWLSSQGQNKVLQAVVWNDRLTSGNCYIYALDKYVGDTIDVTRTNSAYYITMGVIKNYGMEYAAVNSYTGPRYEATKIYSNGTANGTTKIYYNNIGSLVAGGGIDITAWDMPADTNIGWQDVGELIMDYAGTVAGVGVLEGALVDINDILIAVGDALLGEATDTIGLNVVGLDEPIDIVLDQSMVDALEGAAVPDWGIAGQVLDGAVNQPITGSNDGETIQDERPFQYTGEYTLDLSEFFPFCIPYDLYNMLKLFDGTPVAPHFEWPIVVPSLGINETIEIDLSVFDSVAAVLRTLEAIAFGVGLCWATKGLIQGS